MADQPEKSDLQKDLEEKERKRLAGIASPKPQPEQSQLQKDLEDKKARNTPSKPLQTAIGNEQPTVTDKQQRIQHEQERKAKVDAAIEARRPKQQQPAQPESSTKPPEARRDISALYTVPKHRQPAPGQLDAETQAAVARAQARGVPVRTGPPPATPDERTGRVNNLDGELRKQIARIDELFRRIGQTTSVGGGGGCGGTLTTIGSSGQTGDTAGTATWARGAGGSIKVWFNANVSYTAGGAEIIRQKKFAITFPASAICEITGETVSEIDTPDESTCVPE